MPGMLGGLTARGRTLWNGFTVAQRVITVLAVLGLVVGGFAFSKWAGQPSYTPLFSNLSSTDASAIVDKLGSEGVQYQLADGGNTILVPQEKVYALRLKMSGAGLPSGDQTGYALLDKQGITTSEFQQHVDYQRALEGELTKTIQSIHGVNAAVVHLAIPQKDVFADATSKPTSSVLVDTAAGQDLSSQQVEAITNLVSSSIEGMSPNGVTVADSSGKVLSTAGEGLSSTAANDRSEDTKAYEDRVTSNLQSMLDQVVGAGNAVVRVTADLDYDQTQTKSETYKSDPKTAPLSESNTNETFTGAGSGVGGVLGPDNISVPSGTAGGDSRYNKKGTTRDNAVDKVVEQRVAAPGSVNRLSVAVLINSRTGGAIKTADVSRLVTSGAGLDTKRGDAVQVSRMPFDTSAAKEAAKQLSDAKKAEKQESMMSLAKTGGLALLVVVILLLAFLTARRSKRPAEMTDVEVAQIEEAKRLLEIAMPEPAALGSGDSLTPALESAGSANRAVDAERRQAVRTEIGALVERQPEAVAQLLRGWLADRRS